MHDGSRGFGTGRVYVKAVVQYLLPYTTLTRHTLTPMKLYEWLALSTRYVSLSYFNFTVIFLSNSTHACTALRHFISLSIQPIPLVTASLPTSGLAPFKRQDAIQVHHQ